MITIVIVALGIFFTIVFFKVKHSEAKEQWEDRGDPTGAFAFGLISRHEMAQELNRLTGRKVTVRQDRYVDGAEEAANSVRQLLRQFGAELVEVDAEVSVCILNGTRFPLRFTIDTPGYTPGHQPSPHRMDRDCAPDVLVDSVMLGICHFLKKTDPPRPQSR